MPTHMALLRLHGSCTPGRVLRRVMASVLAAALLSMQMQEAWAGSGPPSGATDGQALGQSLVTSGHSLYSTDSAGNITLSSPGLAGQGITVNQLFPGATGTSAADLSAASGTPGTLQTLGITQQQTYSTGTSPDANAYQAVVGSWRQTPPDLSSDPMWATTTAALQNLGTLTSSFADCSSTQTVTPATVTSHVPDYQHCQRLYQPGGTYTVYHTYSAQPPFINPSSNLAWSSCGYGCLDLTVGFGGSPTGRCSQPGWPVCSVFTATIAFTVPNGSAITGVTLYQMQWTDWHTVTTNVSYNAASWFAQGAHTWTIPMDEETTWGSGLLKLHVYYNPSALVTSDSWSSPSDLNLINQIGNGFCTGSVSCAAMPPLDSNGCAIINGVSVCASELTNTSNPSTNPYSTWVSEMPGMSPLCEQVTETISCPFNQSSAMPCWTDPQGQQQCIDNAANLQNSCAQLTANPQCSYVSSKCVDGASGTDGNCYVYEDTYDCGGNYSTLTVQRAVATSCPGPIRCMGTDCVTPAYEQNSHFTDAVGALGAVQNMAMDASRTSANAASSCVLFAGTAATCKKAVGGEVNCCDQPTGVNLADYLNLVFAVTNINSAVNMLSPGNSLRGAWETLRAPIDQVWSVAQQGWTSVLNSIDGSVAPQASDAAAGGLLAGVEQTALNSVASWTESAFGDATTNMLFQGADGALAASGGALTGDVSLGPALAMGASVLGVVGAAYSAYELTVLLIKLIWKCEQSEFQLDADRQLHETHYVGSYCAESVFGTCLEVKDSYCEFSSPLSRILQEQIRLQPQIGLTWGTAKNPDCSGITLAQLQLVDWSKVNLSEWIGILTATNLMPNASRMTAAALTGSGSYLNAFAPAGTSRPDVATRTQQRLQGMDINQLQQTLRSQLMGTVGPH